MVLVGRPVDGQESCLACCYSLVWDGLRMCFGVLWESELFVLMMEGRQEVDMLAWTEAPFQVGLRQEVVAQLVLVPVEGAYQVAACLAS